VPDSPNLWWSATATADDFSRRRLSRAKRLAHLEITEDEFQLYKSLFLSHREQNTYAERRSDGSWPQFKRCWKDNLILRHLCGNTDVAIPFASQVDQIVVDIDFKKGRAWSEVVETVRSSTEAIPGEPVIYRSSHSEGIRMIWFLNRSVPKVSLNEWTKSTLSGAGLRVSPGKCEVRLGPEPDRLPFGQGSMLLDPVTLEPRYDLNLPQTLKVVQDHRASFSARPPALTQIPGSQAKPEYRQIVRACLDSGLPPDVTTNECLKALVWYGRCRLGLEKDELKVFGQDWITNCHHGNSRRINQGKIHVVYNQIDRLVDNLRAEPGNGIRAPIMSAGLSESELCRVLDYQGNFKTLSALFRLLSFSKAVLLHKHKNKSSAGTICRDKRGTNKWGRVFHEKEDIPNGAGNFHFHIDLSKRLLRLLRVPNVENTSRFVADMERLGVLSLKRREWADGGKARQYWVNFPFDLEGKPVSDQFDQALWEVLGFNGIRQWFSKYQAKRIAASMEPQERKESCEKQDLAVV